MPKLYSSAWPSFVHALSLFVQVFANAYTADLCAHPCNPFISTVFHPKACSDELFAPLLHEYEGLLVRGGCNLHKLGKPITHLWYEQGSKERQVNECADRCTKGA